MAAGSGATVKLEQLKAKRVIPDVVEEVDETLLDMRVYHKEIEIANGVAMRVAQTQGKPHVELHGSGFGGTEDKFTLVVVDPDAPRPEHPIYRNFLHWIVVNIPGSLAPSEEIWEQGEEVVPYMGPAPPAGLHRYVFLLFKQEGKLDLTAPSDRRKFIVADFAKQHRLGVPVAASFFTAKHGDDLDFPGNQPG